jgi:hypothetical protein
MGILNRRDMLQLSAACGVGAAISEAAFSGQATSRRSRRECSGPGTIALNGL